MSIPTNIREQIDDIESRDISYRSLHSKAFIIDADTEVIIEAPFLNILSKYTSFLEKIVIERDSSLFDDDLQFKYRYRPKMLSYDLYGTTELWFLLLQLNGCKSIMEFTPKKIKFYDPDRLKSYINEILVLEGILE